MASQEKIFEEFVKISFDLPAFQKGFDVIKAIGEKSAADMAALGKKAGGSFKTAFVAAFAGLGLADAGFLGWGIKLAADLEATQRRFDLVFGKFSGNVDHFVDGMHDKFGIAVKDTKDLLNSFGLLFSEFGASKYQTAALSEQVLTLTNNISRLTGASKGEVAGAIEKAMMGQVRGLRGINIAVTNADLSKELKKLGYDSAASAPQIELAIAAINAIQAKMKELGTLSLGDTFYGVWGKIKNRIEEIATLIGKVFLPLGTAVGQVFEAVVHQLETIVAGQAPKFTEALKGWAELLKDVAQQIKEIKFDDWATTLKAMGSVLWDSFKAIAEAFGNVMLGVAEHIGRAISDGIQDALKDVTVLGMRVLPEVDRREYTPQQKADAKKEQDELKAKWDREERNTPSTYAFGPKYLPPSRDIARYQELNNIVGNKREPLKPISEIVKEQMEAAKAKVKQSGGDLSSNSTGKTEKTKTGYQFRGGHVEPNWEDATAKAAGFPKQKPLEKPLFDYGKELWKSLTEGKKQTTMKDGKPTTKETSASTFLRGFWAAATDLVGIATHIPEEVKKAKEIGKAVVDQAYPNKKEEGFKEKTTVKGGFADLLEPWKKAMEAALGIDQQTRQTNYLSQIAANTKPRNEAAKPATPEAKKSRREEYAKEITDRRSGWKEEIEARKKQFAAAHPQIKKPEAQNRFSETGLTTTTEELDPKRMEAYQQEQNKKFEFSGPTTTITEEPQAQPTNPLLGNVGNWIASFLKPQPEKPKPASEEPQQPAKAEPEPPQPPTQPQQVALPGNWLGSLTNLFKPQQPPVSPQQTGERKNPLLVSVKPPGEQPAKPEQPQQPAIEVTQAAQPQPQPVIVPPAEPPSIILPQQKQQQPTNPLLGVGVVKPPAQPPKLEPPQEKPQAKLEPPQQPAIEVTQPEQPQPQQVALPGSWLSSLANLFKPQQPSAVLPPTEPQEHPTNPLTGAELGKLASFSKPQPEQPAIETNSKKEEPQPQQPQPPKPQEQPQPPTTEQPQPPTLWTSELSGILSNIQFEANPLKTPPDAPPQVERNANPLTGAELGNWIASFSAKMGSYQFPEQPQQPPHPPQNQNNDSIKVGIDLVKQIVDILRSQNQGAVLQ